MVAQRSIVTRAIGIIVATIAAFLATANPVSARQRATDNAPAKARPSIVLAGELELSRLVELTSAAVSASIEYQPVDLSKRVTLRLRDAMTPTELWDAMAATLEANGVVLIDTGKPGLLKALPIAQAPQAARVLPARRPRAARPARLEPHTTRRLSTLARACSHFRFPLFTFRFP